MTSGKQNTHNLHHNALEREMASGGKCLASDQLCSLSMQSQQSSNPVKAHNTPIQIKQNVYTICIDYFCADILRDKTRFSYFQHATKNSLTCESLSRLIMVTLAIQCFQAAPSPTSRPNLQTPVRPSRSKTQLSYLAWYNCCSK